MAATRTKKHHYVPRFYLEHFTDSEGMVWSHDKWDDALATAARKASPENTAVMTNFYSTLNEDGSYNDELEEWLSKVESDAAPLYDRLVKGKFPVGQDKDKLALFFAALYARGPTMINNAARLIGTVAQMTTNVTLETRSQFDETMDRIEAEKSKPASSRQKRDDLYRILKDKKNYSLAVAQKAGLMSMVTVDPITKIFSEMEWILADCEAQHLITSDNPVVKINPDPPHPIYGDGGFLMPNVFITIPLSPRIMLEISRKQPGNKIFKVDKERGKLYNRQRAGFAERYLYSSRSDSGVAALAKKYKQSALTLVVNGPGQLADIVVRRKL